MDQSRFDSLTRALGGASTRRAGLRAALGGLLGLSLAAPLAGGADAKNHKHKRKRSARCGPDKPCPDGQTCDGEGTPVARCRCAGGQLPCGAVCCPDGQECDDEASNPACQCVSDRRPACNGACCPSDQVCFVDHCQACSPAAGACQRDAHCCGSGRCEGQRCCQPEGAACSAPSECCGGRDCCGSQCGSPEMCEMWGFAAG